MSYRNTQILRTRQPLTTLDGVGVPTRTRVQVLAVLPGVSDLHSKRIRATIVDYQYPELYRKKVVAKLGAFMTTKPGRPKKPRARVVKQSALDRELEVAIPDPQYPEMGRAF